MSIYIRWISLSSIKSEIYIYKRIKISRIQMEINKYIAHLFLENGEVRDKEGKIIEDGTVVEFYYDNNPNIPELHRWIPLRTRYDRTESVRRFGKKYGNYINIANKIWRSIKNPVLMDDFITLSNDDVYDKHID